MRTYRFSFDSDQCLNCGVCVDVCPVHSLDMTRPRDGCHPTYCLQINQIDGQQSGGQPEGQTCLSSAVAPPRTCYRPVACRRLTAAATCTGHHSCRLRTDRGTVRRSRSP